MMTRMLEPKLEGPVTGSRKLHDEELHICIFFCQNVINVIRCKRMDRQLVM
jgi:hypothetical protein